MNIHPSQHPSAQRAGIERYFHGASLLRHYGRIVELRTKTCAPALYTLYDRYGVAEVKYIDALHDGFTGMQPAQTQRVGAGCAANLYCSIGYLGGFRFARDAAEDGKRDDKRIKEPFHRFIAGPVPA